MTALELRVDISERAAILEFDNGMSRADAERQAVGEMVDRLMQFRPVGILGELADAAVRWRCQPDINAALDELGLMGKRAPAWGGGYIVSDGRTYRPADPGDRGRLAIIVPSTADGALVDLVAQDLGTGLLHTRLGVAEIVGADEIEMAKEEGRPLLVYATATAWLRSGTRGAVIIDWARAGASLDGVPAILAPAGLVERVVTATRDCYPRPLIATPPGVSHAA